MITYEKATAIALSNSIPDGKVYYAGDAGSFYIFTIIPKDFPTELKDPMFGSTFLAVDKDGGNVWECHVTDKRLKNVKKIFSQQKRTSFKVR